MAGRSSSPAGREDTGTYAQLEEEEEEQRALPVSHVFLMSQPGQPGPYRLATICLATLCGILLISIIAVTAHHKNRPQGDAEGSEQQTQETDVLALTASLRKLQQENVLLRREKDELQAKLAARTVTKAPDGIRLMTKAPAAATVAASPAVCLTDWLVFNNSCYFISRFSRDWLESQSYCQSRGAHLAIIHTAEEQMFLWDQLPRGHWNAFWFGISDEHTEDQWKWVDGSPLVGGFWEVGEPNNHIDEDCGYIVKTRVMERVAIRSWYDAPCTMHWPFICEKEMGAAGSTGMPH